MSCILLRYSFTVRMMHVTEHASSVALTAIGLTYRTASTNFYMLRTFAPTVIKQQKHFRLRLKEIEERLIQENVTSSANYQFTVLQHRLD